MKKIFTLVSFFITLHIGAQETLSSIKIILKDSSNNVISIKKHSNWNAVFSDSSLAGKEFDAVIIDSLGRTIKPILQNKIIRSISKDAHNEKVLYAGIKGANSGDAKVMKSEDFGNSWVFLNGGNPLSEKAEDVQEIVASPYTNKLIFAGTWKHGLYKSTDAGKTFEKVVNFPSSDVRSIIFHPKNDQEILVATIPHGIVKSSDGGNSWEIQNYQEDPFKIVWKMEQSPYDAHEIYALCIRQGLHKTTDFGSTWKKVAEGENAVFYGLGWLNKNVLYCSTIDGQSGNIFMSNDGGDTFTEIENPEKDIISDFLKIDKTLYASGQKNLYIIKNNKVKNTNYLLPFPTISHLLEVKGKLLIATWGNGIRIL
ncbi:sialidase family protein [uncultured Kordia sp.]|uniref:WD40/YVTN/BNR-like repeat-containing protein n=1 Tax=uncultured Kordia sp. TaxID=507699 RepID=UPI00260690C4|nr:sialidase family protein [uncultured Kordia sp.]